MTNASPENNEKREDAAPEAPAAPAAAATPEVSGAPQAAAPTAPADPTHAEQPAPAPQPDAYPWPDVRSGSAAPAPAPAPQPASGGQLPASDAQRAPEPPAPGEQPYQGIPAPSQQGGSGQAPQAPAPAPESPKPAAPGAPASKKGAFSTSKAPMLDVNGALDLKGRVLWFALGFLGGIFGLLASWIASGFWPQPARRQVMWAAFAGFVAQAVLAAVALNTGFITPLGSGSAFDAATSTPEGTSQAFG